MSRAEFKAAATGPAWCAIAAMIGQSTPKLARAIARPLRMTENTSGFSRIRRLVTRPSRINAGDKARSGVRIPLSIATSASASSRPERNTTHLDRQAWGSECSASTSGRPARSHHARNSRIGAWIGYFRLLKNGGRHGSVASLMPAASGYLLAGGNHDGLTRLDVDRREDAVHEAVKDLFDAALNGWKSGLAELRAGQATAYRGGQCARRQYAY